MPFKIITIPFDPVQEGFPDDAVNEFIMNKKVRHRQAQFFTQNDKTYWTLFLEYDLVSDKEEIKPSDLSESQQILLKRLQEWRKQKAHEKGIPVFIVATNKELESLVVKAPASMESLRHIRGFGKKKIEYYGKELINMISAFYKN